MSIADRLLDELRPGLAPGVLAQIAPEHAGLRARVAAQWV